MEEKDFEEVEVINEERKDGGLTQLKYFFTSWTKYFKSIKVGPNYFPFIVIILAMLFAKIPFRYGEMEVNLEVSRATLENTYNNNSMFEGMSQEDIDYLIETNLQSTENMFKVPIYMLTNIIGVAVGTLFEAVLILIIAKIFKGKQIVFGKIFAVSMGAVVITSISALVYSISLSLTGSSIDITSLGILAMNAPVTSVNYVILNSINIAFVISIVFYFFMGKVLFEFNKNKSLIFALTANFIPIIFAAVPLAITNSLM